VLAVVENEEHRPIRDVLDEILRWIARPLVSEPEPASHGHRNQARLRQRRQLDPARALGKRPLEVTSAAKRDPALANAAHAGKGEQPGLREQPVDLCQLCPPSDEAAELGWQKLPPRRSQISPLTNAGPFQTRS
jgi:hypothetical protein